MGQFAFTQGNGFAADLLFFGVDQSFFVVLISVPDFQDFFFCDH
jgi:hypothetical protein